MAPQEAVVDASAAMAFLKREPGGDRLRSYLAQSYMSAVNAAEVVQGMRRYGYDSEASLLVLQNIGLRIVDADLQMARIAGNLQRETKSIGLSLGDRFCLALALERSLPVVATDRRMTEIKLPITVVLLR
jgi:ribonuclease VapC